MMVGYRHVVWLYGGLQTCCKSLVTNEKRPSKEMLICYHLKLSDAEELLCEQIKDISVHKRAN